VDNTMAKLFSYVDSS